jgi:hypothetical protein
MHVNIVQPALSRAVKELEKAEFSKLTAMGWRFPEPFKAKAADGKTDLYGLIWRRTLASQLGMSFLPVAALLIGGLIVSSEESAQANIIVRALGPSLSATMMAGR